jgi:hypothetical protein
VKCFLKETAMKKSKFFFHVLFFSALLHQISYPQFVLNSSYSPVAGDTLKSKDVDTTGISPGPGGENQIWDFSGAVILADLFTETYLIPSATPYYSQFPNSNAASVNSNTPPVYHYYLNADTGSFVLGYVQSPAVMRYYDLLSRMPYPISYPTVLSKPYYGVSEWGNISKHFSGTRTFTCDGYGTIILPIGTFNNVLRIKTVDDVYDTTFSGGIVVGTSHEVVTYHQWFRAGFKFPVFSIVEITPSQNPAWKLVVIEQKNIPIGIIKLSNNIPIKHRLYENYPNPFNSQTKIKFDISTKLFVRITIYEVNGRMIETLVNDTLSAGTYTAVWDAGSYASGIYFCKIEAESFVSTQKMVLIK